jgi:O-antigen/teichoic acid export membrane protein
MTNVAQPVKSGIEARKVRRWLSNGSLAIGDQVFISGSNFLLSVLLARWSSSAEYGAFALAFAIFLLLSQLHQSLLLEPMSVFGSNYSGSRLKRYYGTVLQMQNGMVIAISVPLAIAALLVQYCVHSPQLAAALWGVTIASPFVLLFWMARRAFYLEHSPGRAAAGAMVYTVVTLLSLFIVRQRGALTSFSAFIVMGAAALATSVAMFRRLKPRFLQESTDPKFGAECKDHWQYGSWALAGALAMWIPQNVYYAILPGAQGMAAAADIRALLNLAVPLQRTTAALGMLLLPYVARAYSEGGHIAARTLTRNMGWIFTAGSLAYWAVILLFRDRVLHVLYAGKYDSLNHLLPWLALSSTMSAVLSAVVVALRAMRSPQTVFYAHAVSGAVALAIGIPASWVWGVSGVIFSFIVCNVATLVAVMWLMRRGIELVASHPQSSQSADQNIIFQPAREAQAS